ncbi:MAG: methylmalonyl-CoA mutase family protein [Myxococcota bacterium]
MASTSGMGGGFPPVGEEEWRATAEATTKGGLNRLRAQTDEGLELEPIYFRDPKGLEDERPGVWPYTRGDVAALPFGWGIRQAFADPDLDRVNGALLRDLERGITDVLLVLDEATAQGLDPDSAPDLAGRGGIPLASVDDFDLVLAGVLEDLAPVAIEGGVAGIAPAMLLIGLWQRRARDLASIRGSLGVAPLSAWARRGELPGGPDPVLADLADLARWCSAHCPQVQVARADEGPFHEAGATDAQGLGLLLAETAAVLRAFAERGHDLSVGFRQIELAVRVGSEVFGGVAKLRAARLLMSRLSELLELDREARPYLTVRQGRRELTRDDPWVNLLRGTAATFAAAVGGARALTLEPFDFAWGLPDRLGRRMARNTQLILQEESHLARVADPAGGSWYVEERTERLAAAAWTVFTEIESQGGLAAALQSGFVQAEIAAAREEREVKVAKRKRPFTGVSEYPDPTEKPLLREDRPEGVAEKAKGRLNLGRARAGAVRIGEDRIASALDAARSGASLGAIHSALYASRPAAKIPPMPSVRLAEMFEALRDRGRESPSVYLANLGPVARHTARAGFVANLVGVGGLEAVHGPPTLEPSETAEAFRASGARVAFVCGADEDYVTHAEAFVRALREAGATAVHLAGTPGVDLAPVLEAAGLSGHVAFGVDVPSVLESILTSSGGPS